MRLFSEMIIFVAVCLLMFSVMYGVQEAFFADGAPAESGRWQSRTHTPVPRHSSGFPTEDTELPSAPAKPPEPILAPAPIPRRPAAPGAEDFEDAGDPFFGTKFRKL